MTLKINGEETKDIRATTVAELLSELKIEPARVAVEVNLTIVRKADYAQFRIHDKDTVEIVNFVGGG